LRGGQPPSPRLRRSAEASREGVDLTGTVVGHEIRRHFNVVAESLRDDIRLLAEGQMAIVARLDGMVVDLDTDRSVPSITTSG
jgi:hypothetical protein